MIDRAAELALLGCIPMSFGDDHRVIGPGEQQMLGSTTVNGHPRWDVYKALPAGTGHYAAAEWAAMELDTVPQVMYDKFVRAIRP